MGLSVLIVDVVFDVLISLESAAPDTYNTTLYTTPSPTQPSATTTHDILLQPADTDDQTSNLTFFSTPCPELAVVRPESSKQLENISSLDLGNLRFRFNTDQISRPLVDTTSRIEHAPDIVVELPTPVSATEEQPILFEIRSSQVNVKSKGHVSSVEETKITIVKEAGKNEVVREITKTEKEVSKTPQPLIKQLSDLRISEMFENETSLTASGVEETLPIISLPDEESVAAEAPKERFIPIQLEDQPGVFVISKEAPSETSVSIEEMETTYPDDSTVPVSSNKVNDDQIADGLSTAKVEQFSWIVQPLVGQEAQDIVGEYDVSSVEVVPKDEAHRRTSIIVCTGNPVLVAEETSPIREVQTSQATIRLTPKLKRVSESDRNESIKYSAIEIDASQPTNLMSVGSSVLNISPQATGIGNEESIIQVYQCDIESILHKYINEDYDKEISIVPPVILSDTATNSSVPERKATVDVPIVTEVTATEIPTKTKPSEEKSKLDLKRSVRRKKGTGISKVDIEVQKETTSPTTSPKVVPVSDEVEKYRCDISHPIPGESAVKEVSPEEDKIGKETFRFNLKRPTQPKQRTGAAKTTSEEEINVESSSFSDKESSFHEDDTTEITWKTVAEPSQVPADLQPSPKLSTTEKEKASIQLKRTTRRKIRTSSNKMAEVKIEFDSVSSSDRKSPNLSREHSVLCVKRLQDSNIPEKFQTEFYGPEQQELTLVGDSERVEKCFITKRPKHRKLRIDAEKRSTERSSDIESGSSPETEEEITIAPYRTEEKLEVQLGSEARVTPIVQQDAAIFIPINEMTIHVTGAGETQELFKDEYEFSPTTNSKFKEHHSYSVKEKHTADANIDLITPQPIIIHPSEIEEPLELALPLESPHGHSPLKMDCKKVNSDVVEGSQIQKEKNKKIRMSFIAESHTVTDKPSKDETDIKVIEIKRDEAVIFSPTKSVEIPLTSISELTKFKQEKTTIPVDLTTNPTQTETSSLKSQENIKLEPANKLEDEISCDTGGKTKKPKWVPIRESTTFEEEKISLKPVKKQPVSKKEDDNDNPKEIQVVEGKSITRKDFLEEQMQQVDARIELKKKPSSIKQFDKESRQQCPEITPLQQEYKIESIQKVQPETPTPIPDVCRKVVEVAEQKQCTTSETQLKLKPETAIEKPIETVEFLNKNSELTLPFIIQSEELASVTSEPLQIVKDVVEVDKIEIKKKPIIRKTEISLAPESVFVDQPGATEKLEFKVETSLPLVIQPEEAEPVQIESSQIDQDVIQSKDIEIKKKPRIRKTEISLTSGSGPVGQLEPVEQFEIKSGITLPKDITPEEPASITTQPLPAQETSIKYSVVKKKPQTKANLQSTEESSTAQQPEKTEQLELKSEIVLPSEIQTEENKQETAKPIQPIVTMVYKKKKPKFEKSEISLAPVDSVPVEGPEILQPLTLGSEITLPSQIQPEQTELLRVVQEVGTLVDTKKKLRIKKSVISFVPESEIVQQPTIAQPITLKSEIRLPSYIQPEKFTPVLTESLLEIQDITKEVATKKKPRTKMTEISLAPKSVVSEQSEDAEPLELKSEMTLPVSAIPEPTTEATNFNVVGDVQETKAKSDVGKKEEKSSSTVKIDGTEISARHIETPQEKKLLQFDCTAPSDLQIESSIHSHQKLKITTLDDKEEETHQSVITLESLSKSKDRKKVIKKVSITESLEPTPLDTKSISIEMKPTKREILEVVPTNDQNQMESYIFLPQKENELSESSNFITLTRPVLHSDEGTTTKKRI
uniref:KASH domain-containing protein n=1 Tax=Daphnia galeata TaxID=27404 RepID=A0A8J2RRI7_9CRUS|nr:unnamed protein product [Daphnia galeata]